jgi:hypothetical protein
MDILSQITCLKIGASVDSMLISQGRIAQLVELLSYTQAVIGSSPVAPKHSKRE